MGEEPHLPQNSVYQLCIYKAALCPSARASVSQSSYCVTQGRIYCQLRGEPGWVLMLLARTLIQGCLEVF